MALEISSSSSFGVAELLQSEAAEVGGTSSALEETQPKIASRAPGSSEIGALPGFLAKNSATLGIKTHNVPMLTAQSAEPGKSQLVQQVIDSPATRLTTRAFGSDLTDLFRGYGQGGMVAAHQVRQLQTPQGAVTVLQELNHPNSRTPWTPVVLVKIDARQSNIDADIVVEEYKNRPDNGPKMTIEFRDSSSDRVARIRINDMRIEDNGLISVQRMNGAWDSLAKVAQQNGFVVAAPRI